MLNAHVSMAFTRMVALQQEENRKKSKASDERVEKLAKKFRKVMFLLQHTEFLRSEWLKLGIEVNFPEWKQRLEFLPVFETVERWLIEHGSDLQKVIEIGGQEEEEESDVEHSGESLGDRTIRNKTMADATMGTPTTPVRTRDIYVDCQR